MTDVKDITLEAAQPVKAVFNQGADRDGKVTLSPALSKGGNVYWRTPGGPKAVKFGIKVVPPKGFTGLPDRVRLENLNGVSIGGQELTLTPDMTTDGRPKVAGSKVVDVPSGDTTVQRLLQVSISVTKDQNWQLKCSASGLGGGEQEAAALFE
jgi:hypothetical protein